MRSQRRGRRHAEDEVETVGAAEVDRLRRAIMAVGTQQNFGLGPIAANGAQQAAQEGPDLLAAGPSSGTQNGGDEAAGAVEHDDRLKAVFVIVPIEQPQLLATVDGIEHVVDVEGDALGDLRERFAIEVNTAHYRSSEWPPVSADRSLSFVWSPRSLIAWFTSSTTLRVVFHG
jgi:hypothetical protein